jgi:hypothetical protein
MPAFADALSAEEIARVVAHLRGFCTDRSWPRGELNLPRALFTEKAFPENEALTIASMATGGAGDFAQTFIYERRLGARQQLEVTAPLTVTRADGAWTGGVGDMTVGLKHVLAHSIERGSILTVGSELVLPTGDEEAGGGVTRIEPFVAFGRMLPSDGFLQAQAGVELSTSPARAPHEAFWRAALGRSFSQHTFGRTWSPMIEVLGARELESGASAEWDVTPQLQVTLSTRQHIAASGGVRIPVSQRGSRHARVIVYVLWDWFDGGLASGW